MTRTLQFCRNCRNKSNGLDGPLKAVAFMYNAIYFVIAFA